MELYRLDLEAGVIDDPMAKQDPEAFLAERALMSRQLVQRQRELQRISSRTYIYARSRSQTGATMSRRIDITEQASTEARLREREQELHALAFRDPLTGLWNRACLRERLADLQSQMEDGTLAGVAAFLIDLNGFKTINDTYGHDCGDHVLKVVAQRLTQSELHGDLIVRLGGDEFVVLCAGHAEERKLAGIADDIIALLAEPVPSGDLELQIGTSIGIAQLNGSDADLGQILSDADLAMYEAKKQKTSGYQLFRPMMRTVMVERLGFLNDIREALGRNEFELHYQPQFSMEGERPVGFEALARWHHPDRGFVLPDVFIPVIEENGLMDTFGEWVLDTACTEARTWPGDLRVAVNVSPSQVRSDRFSFMVCQALMRTGLPPHRLELEVTESVFIGGEPRTRARLEQWKSLGVRISVDDFGHGSSSLSHLSKFPIDAIKIDPGFTGEFDVSNPHTPEVLTLRTMIELGHALGKTVTVEGVNESKQFEYLTRYSCTGMQGSFLGEPMPHGQLGVFLDGISKSSSADVQSAPRSA